MTAPILQALNSGFTSQQVLNYLIRKFPQHAKKISHAISLGYTPSQVLSYLSGGKAALNNDIVGQTEHEATMKADKRRRNTNEALVAGTAAAAAGGLGLGLSRLGAAGSNAVHGQLLPALPGGGRIAGSPTLQIGNIPVNVPPNPTPTNPNPSPNNMGQPSQNLAGGYGQPPATQTPPGTPPQNQAINPSNGTPSPLQPPVQNVPSSVAQPPQSVQPQGILTPEETALKNIEQRKAESEKLFELAKQPRMSKEHLTPFMKVARQLVKKGDIKDADTFDEFRKYWEATEGKYRGSSFVEFEKYRRAIGSNAEAPKEPEKQTKEEHVDPDLKYPKEFFKGKKKEEVDQFANKLLDDAFSEIEEGISQGEDYGVFHGNEWQAVGSKDVNEGAPNAPNVPKRHIQPGKKLIKVIEKHIPIRGLYQYYFDTPQKKKKMPFDKFSRGYEKAVEEMIVKKTNPELYEKQHKQEEEFLKSIQNDEVPEHDLFDEMEEEIRKVLFKNYDEDFEQYLEKMVKSIR